MTFIYLHQEAKPSRLAARWQDRPYNISRACAGLKRVLSTSSQPYCTVGELLGRLSKPQILHHPGFWVQFTRGRAGTSHRVSRKYRELGPPPGAQHDSQANTVCLVSENSALTCNPVDFLSSGPVREGNAGADTHDEEAFRIMPLPTHKVRKA